MQRFKFLFCSIILCFGMAFGVQGQVKVKMPDKSVDAVRWIETRFAKGKIPPFSFVCDGKPSESFIKKWKYSASHLQDDPSGVVNYRYTYTDPKSGLQVECRVKGFPAFHAVEWVLSFTNTGDKNSPVLEKVQVVNVDLEYPASGEFKLHRADGNHISKEDFHPRMTLLKTDSLFHMAPQGGRSSEGDHLPFFNIESPAGAGVVVGVGWTGTWFADICRTTDRSVSLASGMKNMQLYLYPQESIRTPSICLLFWQGDDRMTGQNQFRRFLLTHHTRQKDGKYMKYPLCSGFNYRDPSPCTEYSMLTADWAIAMMRRYKQFNLVPEVFWLDAGWNSGAADYEKGLSWANTVGNWTIDSTRFPQGLKPIADEAHRLGTRFMVWFEPERVIKGTQWAVEHPEWMLDLPSEPDGTYLLFDLGNPQAREWLCHYIGDLIQENGIDYYRQDFNMQPDKYWAAHDTPGRIGMKEIRHIEGLYAFWDYLQQRFPDLLIDNCASGGRRLDLETTSRSAPLWRSDYYHYDDPEGYQGHTYGLNFFLPIHGTGSLQTDPYSFRSSVSSALIYNWKITEPGVSILDMQRSVKEYKEIRDYFYEDYYPLTGIEGTTRSNIWLAYQMHRPSDDTGIIMAFRRSECPEKSVTVKLSGLRENQNYTLLNSDTGETLSKIGRELADGFTLTLDNPKSSLLIKYRPAQ